MQRHTHNLTLTPITLRLAFKFCDEFHSYQKRPQGGLFALGAMHSGELECVVIIGRPSSTVLSDGSTCQVSRLISTGRTFNAASFLLARAARAAFSLGYRRIISYTDSTLTAAAYRAAGWNIAREHRVKPWHGREMRDEVGRSVLRWELINDSRFIASHSEHEHESTLIS